MPLPDPTTLGLPTKPTPAGAPQAGPSRTAAPASSTTSTTATTAALTTHTPSPLSTSTTPTTSTACALCPTPAKYTCPRCSMRTCSLPCSRTHKTLGAGCSGERDPAAFVPLNRITQGTWDGDYAWLEATRRQVGVWGEGVSVEEAAGQGVVVGGESSRGGRGGARGARGGRGGGRGGAAPNNSNRKSKLDGLRWAMAEVGAEVDLLPEGMQRRRTNQSSWNPKSRTLFLTVQLSLPPSLSDTPLVSHLRCAVLPAPGATLGSLLQEGPLRDRRAANKLIFVLPHHTPRRRAAYQPPSTSAAKRFFPPLDPEATLDVVFNGTAFVEFPTVQVWERGEWERAVAEGSVVVVPLGEGRKRKAEQEERSDGDEDGGEEAAEERETQEGETGAAASKKPRTDAPAAATVAASGLGLGDYGDSDEDDEEDNDAASDTADAEGGGDITLAPEMAAALGAALVADFGVQEVRE